MKENQKIKIALIQQFATSDKSENLQKGLKAAEQAAMKGAHIICFAELAFEPFYPQRRPDMEVNVLAETVPGPVTHAFSKLAIKHGVVIVLNLFELENGRTFDSSPVIDADGRLLGKTQMMHVPDYEHFHEKAYYSPGKQGAPVYETPFGKIGVAICYDRHFPEYMRLLALQGADIVFVPQAGAVDEWPEGLYEAEMRVAAFQNGYFTALCNRVGKEEFLEFSGESFVCDPEGNVIARAAQGEEEILYSEIDKNQLAASNARKLFLRDRRPKIYGLISEGK